MENFIFQGAIILLFPLLFRGIIEKVKSRLSGRKGPSIFQPYFDFFKLLKKGEVTSRTTSFVFQIYPVAALGTVIMAGLLLPGPGQRSLISFEGDFILFAYVLSLGNFLALVSALDTGSSFEGMGASREAFFSSIPEPAFFIVFGSLCLNHEFFSFEKLIGIVETSSELRILVCLLVAVILFILLLLEGKRIPVDDPLTHLELTMTHEAMILDNSGPSLAFIQLGSAMKMVLFSVLLVNLFLPIATPFSGLLIMGGVCLIAVVIGVLESSMARLRLVRVPDFLLPTIGLSLIVMFVILLIFQGGLK